jgi:hypothetical protein
MTRTSTFKRTGHSSAKCVRKNRGLRFENLECRALMSVSSPVSTVEPKLAASNAVTAAAVTIDSKEFEGLSTAEQNQLNSLAAGMSADAAAAATVVVSARLRSDGTLVIHGCKGNDTVTVGFTNDNCGAVQMTHEVNGARVVPGQRFYNVTNILFFAYDGANVFHNNTTLRSCVVGGSGKDTFTGSNGEDVFYGLEGGDTLSGNGGNDRLYGGSGADVLTSDTGPFAVSVVKGGRDNDKLTGGDGLDYLYGDSGIDTIVDGNGMLNGGSGNDILKGTNVGYLEMHGGSGQEDTIKIRSSISDYVRVSGDDFDGSSQVRNQTFNALPVVRSLSANSSAITVGANVTLTANGVADDQGMRGVTFFRESNGLPGFQYGYGGDTFLVDDRIAADGWKTVIATDRLAVGRQVFYAIATDSNGAYCQPVSTAVTLKKASTASGSLSAAYSRGTGTPFIALKANGLTGPDGTVSSVIFYRETNGQSGFQSTDEFIAADYTPGNGWSAVLPAGNLASGQYTFWAVAKGSDGRFGQPVSAAVAVSNSMAAGSQSATLANALALSSVLDESVDTEAWLCELAGTVAGSAERRNAGLAAIDDVFAGRP